MDAINEGSQEKEELPAALSLLAGERPRNVGWLGAAGLLFGDWGTSRLYVLGLAFLLAGPSSFYLIAAMSLLILAVGWAYTQICRIYPDGGGVYSAARHRNRVLGVVGALLLFADYTVTASLSAVDAFHYFGLSDTGSTLGWQSPGLWAIISILLIGAVNLLGPKHTSGYAVLAAIPMVMLTLLVAVVAVPQVNWKALNVSLEGQSAHSLGLGFVGIILALSGVEAIANLTGVMKKPVYTTARKSIWVVAGEVAVFNLLLAVVMVAIAGLDQQKHKEDMLAFLAKHYIGGWGELPVRMIGGLLLLSATNTAVNGLTGITYVMSRDGEMPQVLQKLNGFGSPWIATMLASGAPVVVLLFTSKLEMLASLYAIGVVGAISINVTLCAFHPRLRRWWRKTFMLALGLLMIGIGLTVAITKPHARLFVCIVLVAGLLARRLTQYRAARHPKPSLLRQAIMEQLTAEALAKPRLLLATAGSTRLAEAAFQKAREEEAALVVCFVRPVVLSYMFRSKHRMGIDTDPAAQKLFVDFLELGYQYAVPIMPSYDTGTEPAEMIAELAAINNVKRVLIGTSRRGAIHQLIKGSFQRMLENLLPPGIAVEVLTPARTEVAPKVGDA